ncbi:MAG: UDP-3-O-(3-hydroxymyristoyl)glucosamine N-acyltransferase [Candidatus Brocadia sp. WS118]|nr:MAG: UDP-3-O-(3-hydroxymyristoyl)glucosamine N-acyltransferase [Candidatus Brocadia sp. WS118]
MEKTLQELSEYVGGTVIGDPSVKIRNVMGIDDAREGDITFISNDKYIKKINQTKASAIIVSPKLKDTSASLSQKKKRNLLICNNPYLAFAKLVELLMYKKPAYPAGIDNSARIDKTAVLGQNISVQSYVTIGKNTRIGDRVVLHPCVYIGDGCAIGDDTMIYPNAVIYNETIIGKRVTIHSNTVIGSSGFGYAPDGQGYYKIPQVGSTTIEDDVDIGANTTINRAVMGETVIRKGTKIDSQVVISHNVEVGENSLIVSQVGIAGSAKIGRHVTLAGGSGVVGHIQIGDNVTIGGYSGVTKDVPSNKTYLGAPALPIQRMRRCYVIIEKLPEMRDGMKILEKRVAHLEKRNIVLQAKQKTRKTKK